MGRKSWKTTKTEKCPICSKDYKFLARHIEMKHNREDAVDKEDHEKDKEDHEKDKGGTPDQPDIAVALKRIGDKLERIDTDFCSKFPDLCAKVDRLEQAIPDTVEPGSERWTTTRKADIEHSLFGDCPECNAIRDKLLADKGKRITDVEVEAKVDEVPEAKVDETPEAKVDETPEAKVDEDEAPKEKRTSGGWFHGSVWDETRELYVEE